MATPPPTTAPLVPSGGSSSRQRRSRGAALAAGPGRNGSPRWSRFLRTLGTAALLPAASPAAAGPHGWVVASDAGRDALVVVALGLPAARGDWRGDLEAGSGMAAAGGTTLLLKDLVHERRPDRSDDHSFPSGHTSVSFAAATSLERRYGWRVGFPALAVATFVGTARVAGDKHYVHDVLAGAAIGGAAGWLLSSRRDRNVALVPWAEPRGGGLSLSARW